jgi:hypothetical protein
MTARLDRDATFSVKGWDGIAFYVHSFPKVWAPYDEDDQSEGEWEEQDETCGRVNVVMVGDDRKYEVDVSDLTKLDEGGYCAGCGQIGCGWNTN